MRRKIFFSLAVALQIGVLLFMMGMKSYTLAYGAKIMLKTAPVDPWDLFRGDYVTLNYEISRLNLKSIDAGGEKFKRNLLRLWIKVCSAVNCKVSGAGQTLYPQSE